jgi:hypothetical protein
VADEWQTSGRQVAEGLQMGYRRAEENNDYNEKQKTENKKICKTNFELFDNQG